MAGLGFGQIALAHPEVRDEYADLNDRITNTLIKQLRNSPIMLIETYPWEVYPVDNCFVIGSLGLHQLATEKDHRQLINRWGTPYFWPC